MDLANSPARKLVHKFCRKEISAKEYGETIRKHCLEAQDKYNLFISIPAEESINKDLLEIQNNNRAGQKLSLMGIPLVLEDNICTSTIKTTCASKMLFSYQPPVDAKAYLRCKNNGAFLLGKTNMEEFGLGSTGGSSFFGGVRNPGGKNLVAGSGAAAALSCGVAELALATDTRGELRQAASFCGVMALKPTAGRIPCQGLVDYAPSLAQIGIMANTTADLALALETVAGSDPKDPTTLNTEVPSYASLLHNNSNNNDSKLTVAIPQCWAEAPFLDDEARHIFRIGLEKLEEKGFKVYFVNLPHFKYSSVAAEIIGSGESFSNLANLDGVRFGYRKNARHLQEMYTKTRSEGFNSKIKKYLVFGALNLTGKYNHTYFYKAQKIRSVISDELKESLAHYHLLLTPTTPFTAPGLDSSLNKCQIPEPACYYTAAANLTGFPALTYPAKTDSQLPFGLQFIGKAGDETTLLQTALLLEKTGTI